MIITLVRHSEVEEKYIGCYNGHNDISLSPKGYTDAKKIGDSLKGSSFDAIFCSDLLRAKETLKQFVKNSSVSYTCQLREKSWGRHEGMSFDEITKQENLKYIDFNQWINALDGERIEDFILRVDKFFFEYLPSIDKKNILVVTHSGVIKVFISILQDIKTEDAFCISVPYSSHVVYNSKTKKLDFYD